MIDFFTVWPAAPDRPHELHFETGSAVTTALQSFQIVSWIEHQPGNGLEVSQNVVGMFAPKDLVNLFLHLSEVVELLLAVFSPANLFCQGPQFIPEHSNGRAGRLVLLVSARPTQRFLGQGPQRGWDHSPFAKRLDESDPVMMLIVRHQIDIRGDDGAQIIAKG